MEASQLICKDALFFGDSLIAYMPKSWSVLNKGLGGMSAFTLKGLLDELVIQNKPSTVVLHIGANDLRNKSMSSPQEIASNVKEIFNTLIAALPKSEFYLISSLPCLDDVNCFFNPDQRQDFSVLHKNLNIEYQKTLKDLPVTYLDLSQYLINADGSVKKEYYEDSLHLKREGYDYLRKSYEENLK